MLWHMFHPVPDEFGAAVLLLARGGSVSHFIRSPVTALDRAMKTLHRQYTEQIAAAQEAGDWELLASLQQRRWWLAGLIGHRQTERNSRIAELRADEDREMGFWDRG
jgi:hypothetical protein